MPSTLRVFLADDHAVVREGLKSLLNSQPDMQVIGEASNGREAQQKLCECQADIAVLDLAMPEIGGAELTTWLQKNQPHVGVIALTVHEDRGYLLQLMQAGARGYVLKRAAADELVRAVRNVSAGKTYIDPSLGAHLLPTAGRSSAPAQPRSANLTDRELEIAKLIVEGYSNKEIAAELQISVKTVETHKAKVMEKLGFRSRVHLVRFAIDQGWLKTP